MAYELTSLDIRLAGNPVENHFFSTDGANRLALILPGMGYSSMGPMLYYSVNTLTQLGADTLVLEYGSIVRLLPKGNHASILELCLEALNTALDVKKYDRMSFVGKSIGTLALALLNQSRDRWKYVPDQIESVWLTPLLSDPNVVQEIGLLGNRQLLAIGSEDHPHYRPDVLEGLPRTVEKLILKGADHGLDIEGNSVASVREMASLIERIGLFLSA